MRYWKYYTIANSNLLQISISGMPVVEASLTLSFLCLSMLVVASRRLSSSVSSTIRFLFSTWLLRVENVVSHMYVLPNIEFIFSVKSFNLGNQSLLTNFQKLSTVYSNAVNIVHFSWKMLCLFWLKLLTVTYTQHYNKEKARWPQKLCQRAACSRRVCNCTTLN